MPSALEDVQLYKSARSAREVTDRRDRERRRALLVLTLRFLADSGYGEAAERLSATSGVSLSCVDAADNVDLPRILAEWEEEQEVRWGRRPKLTRPVAPCHAAGGGGRREVVGRATAVGLPPKPSGAGAAPRAPDAPDSRGSSGGSSSSSTDSAPFSGQMAARQRREKAAAAAGKAAAASAAAEAPAAAPDEAGAANDSAFLGVEGLAVGRCRARAEASSEDDEGSDGVAARLLKPLPVSTVLAVVLPIPSLPHHLPDPQNKPPPNLRPPPAKRTPGRPPG
jgi:katanin p60 ATPase-containing subunit A1